MQKAIFIFSITFCLISGALSQSKDDLQKQRQQLKRDIEETERVLNETRKIAKTNIITLNIINKRIFLQDKVINNISGQINLIENDIYKSQREVTKLARVLDTLKQEYSKSMVDAYKNRNNYDFLNFIFSAASFNDAIRRITYLKSFRNYREMQGENILRTKELLQQRIAELSGNKEKKNEALEEKGKEMSELEKKQNEKEKIVTELKGRQKELTAQITNKKKQDAKLKNMISVMIKREIAKAEEERKKALALEKENKNNSNTVTTTTSTSPKRNLPKETKAAPSILVNTEADRALNADFERNRGSLPWPVNGTLLAHYGSNTIPGTNVIWENAGVSIATQTGATVKAIFNGEITLVSYMEDKQVVFIKHGKYFSVYSNLASSNVQRGQTVTTGQAIGKAAVNDDGQGEVDLIIMKETNNVNPEQWLHH